VTLLDPAIDAVVNWRRDGSVIEGDDRDDHRRSPMNTTPWAGGKMRLSSLRMWMPRRFTTS
jgi:hypothetical protein